MKPKRHLPRINTPVFGFNGGHGPLNRMEDADQHNEVELNFVSRGKFTIQHGTRTLTLGPGEMIIYWAAIPHQVLGVEPQTEGSWLVIPLSWFLAWNLSLPFRNKILNGQVLQVTPSTDNSRLTQWGSEIGKESPELKKIIELELEAYFRRLALTPTRQRLRSWRPSTEKSRYSRVQQMIQFMTAQFRNPITIPQIAASADLNPEYAMRLFRKSWGMTLWDFLIQQRVFEAQRLLVISDSKVVDIGFSSGFNSTSRFYSAFTKYCHCSPLAYRRKQVSVN